MHQCFPLAAVATEGKNVTFLLMVSWDISPSSWRKLGSRSMSVYGCGSWQLVTLAMTADRKSRELQPKLKARISFTGLPPMTCIKLPGPMVQEATESQNSTTSRGHIFKHRSCGRHSEATSGQGVREYMSLEY